MKSLKFNLTTITERLRDRCPFILFALITGLDEEGWLHPAENLELSVYIGSGTGTWHALEKILPVVSAMIPETFCDVTLLNHVDATTRFRAIHGVCLFIREDKEQNYSHFVQHATLDYQIMRARGRRLGIIDND